MAKAKKTKKPAVKKPAKPKGLLTQSDTTLAAQLAELRYEQAAVRVEKGKSRWADERAASEKKVEECANGDPKGVLAWRMTTKLIDAKQGKPKGAKDKVVTVSRFSRPKVDKKNP